MKLSEIQKEFTQLFPYLKLMFFAHTHKQGEPSSHDDLLSPELTVQEAGVFDGHAQFDILPSMAVSALEKDFQKHYKIGVQVFRRSGNVWLQTSVTDNWSLETQNETGKSDTLEKLEPEVSVDGFREQD
jgi:hypothetical protein